MRPDTTPPELRSAVAYAHTLTLTYNEPLDSNSKPNTARFQVKVNGVIAQNTPSEVLIGGNVVMLTLPKAVKDGEVLTVSYSRLSGDQIQDAAGNAAANLANALVDNRAMGINGLRNWDRPYICDTGLPKEDRTKYERFNYGGSVRYAQRCGAVGWVVRDRYGDPIRSDMPQPGVIQPLAGGTYGVYKGDTWLGPIQDGNLQPPPLSYSGAAVQDGTAVWTSDDGNHRAVLVGGQYYREERIRSRWVRSESYGSTEQAKNNAERNASSRSMGRHLTDVSPQTQPTSTTLVSNTGQTQTDISAFTADQGQSFTTGANANGYTVNEITMKAKFDTDSPTVNSFTVSIWSNSNGNLPHQELGTFSPNSIKHGTNSFTSPGIDLEPNTTYWVVFDVDTYDTSDLNHRPDNGIYYTNSGDEDDESATGWSIGDINGAVRRVETETVWGSRSKFVRQMSISGYAKQGAGGNSGGGGGAGGQSGQAQSNANDAPAVTALAITSDPGADDTYGLDDVIRVQATFSEAVNVTGAPRLKIDMDPEDWGEKWAEYASGSGTTTLTFTHTVVEPNISTQGIAVLANSLDLNGGTIQSSGGGDAWLNHAGLAHDANHKVDWQTASDSSGGSGDGGVSGGGSGGGASGNGGKSGPEPAETPAPTVTAVAITSDAGSDNTYVKDDVIRITVTFGATVDVTGSPRLKIDMDPAEWGEKWAAYESGSGSANLVFAHTVAEPNLSTQGIAVLANTLQLNGGTIRSPGGSDATLSHAGLAHDGSHQVRWQPTVTAVAITSDAGADNTYVKDDVIQITVTFSEAVDVTGNPRLKIDMDPAEWGEKWASYEGGNGTTALTFTHTVVEPNISTQGIAVLANTLQLNGGTIQSASDADADLAHTGLAHDAGHKVDWTQN